jgi:hypothetical protein
MSYIKLYLYLILLLKIFSSESLNFLEDEKSLFNSEDLDKCFKYTDKIQNMSPTTTNPCSSINSSLELKENKCCRCTADYDPLKEMKKYFPENADWKKELSKIYGFDENLSEKEIREKYFKIIKKNFCLLMTEDEEFNNYNLYANVVNILDGIVTYDCGDGEKSFDPMKYSPEKQQYKLLKDKFDCKFQNNESSCHKTASKFMSDDMLACWHKIESPHMVRCFGYQESEYKDIFKKMFKDYLKRSDKIEETWSCVNKKGKEIKIYMNTFTGEFSIN